MSIDAIYTKEYRPGSIQEITRPEPTWLISELETILSGEDSYTRQMHEELGPTIAGLASQACERFNNAQEQSRIKAYEILKGRRWESWDPQPAFQRHQRLIQVVAPGMFVSVFGNHPLQKLNSVGPLSLMNMGDMDGPYELYIDALTNATVSNNGVHPLNTLAATVANLHANGTYCLAYHDGPFVRQASQSLLDLHPMYRGQGKVWWGNDGGSATAFAIHLARKAINSEKGYRTERGIVAFKEAYHGNVQNKGGDITPGIGAQDTGNSHIIEFPDLYNEVEPAIEELAKLIEEDRVSVIVMEATQGDGGGVQMHPDFFIRMLKISIDRNIPLIFDEIQSGFGRSGRIFNFEHLLEQYQADKEVVDGKYPANPDNIITLLGKSLTDGVSAGSAVIFHDRYAAYNGRGEGVATYAAFPGTLGAAIATTRLTNNPGYLDLARGNRQTIEEALGPYIGNGLIKRTRGNGSHLFVEIGGEPILYRNGGQPVGNHELAQVLLAERFRILTGTVARGGLRVHLPVNADPIVYHAVGLAIGEVTELMIRGQVGVLAPIFLQQVSGLAGRTVSEF